MVAKKKYEDKDRGFVYLVSPFTFPGDGSKGVSIKTVYVPDSHKDCKGYRATFYRVSHELRGDCNLYGLFERALKEPAVEIMDD